MAKMKPCFSAAFYSELSESISCFKLFTEIKFNINLDNSFKLHGQQQKGMDRDE